VILHFKETHEVGNTNYERRTLKGAHNYVYCTASDYVPAKVLLHGIVVFRY